MLYIVDQTENLPKFGCFQFPVAKEGDWCVTFDLLFKRDPILSPFWFLIMLAIILIDCRDRYHFYSRGKFVNNAEGKRNWLNAR